MKTRPEEDMGFTLYELMIVVTVIALIAAFAIPSMLGSLKASKEASAISALRSLSSISEQYTIRFGGYADSLDRLRTNGYIDSHLGSGTKAGYTYAYVSTRYTWFCNASPEELGVTGDRYFFADQSGVIRFSHAGPATSTDEPVE